MRIVSRHEAELSTVLLEPGLIAVPLLTLPAFMSVLIDTRTLLALLHRECQWLHANLLASLLTVALHQRSACQGQDHHTSAGSRLCMHV